jgi:hypothetical protein
MSFGGSPVVFFIQYQIIRLMSTAQQPILIQVLLAAGKLGTGKNYVIERILHPMLPVRPTMFIAFANHFKMEAIVKDGLDRERVFGDKDEYTRKAIQLRGTEQGRDVFGPNIWTNIALEWLYSYLPQGYTRFIFTDGRFPNEVDSVMALNNTTIELRGKHYQFQVTSMRLIAPQRSQARAEAEASKTPGTAVESITGHISETALDSYQGFTYEIYNDYECDVYPTMKAIARTLTAESAPYLCYVVDVDDTLCQCGLYYTAVLHNAEMRIRQQALNAGLDADAAVTLLQWEFTRVYAWEHYGIFMREQFGTDVQSAYLRAGQALGAAAKVELDLKQDSEALYAAGLAVFEESYPALPGAILALNQLEKLGKVVLYTHGDRIEQVAKIARLGLSHLPIYVTPSKGIDSLAQLMAEYPATNYVSIGDNYRRESEPASRLRFARTYWITQDWLTEDAGVVKARELGIHPVPNIAQVGFAEMQLAGLAYPEPVGAAM